MTSFCRYTFRTLSFIPVDCRKRPTVQTAKEPPPRWLCCWAGWALLPDTWTNTPKSTRVRGLLLSLSSILAIFLKPRGDFSFSWKCLRLNGNLSFSPSEYLQNRSPRVPDREGHVRVPGHLARAADCSPWCVCVCRVCSTRDCERSPHMQHTHNRSQCVCECASAQRPDGLVDFSRRAERRVPARPSDRVRPL